MTISPERQADTVIKLQLEKAGVRLACLLDASLLLDTAGQIVVPKR
ncbi:MAG TPA: hypothetical protein VKO18_00185 [Terriglobia bacterium]|nr:hypothetical protein [Terriglobia bacterium]